MQIRAHRAVYDFSHASSEGHFWALRPAHIPLEVLDALVPELEASPAYKEVRELSEGDCVGGVVLRANEAIAFRFCFGDRDERGRPGRVVIALLFLDRDDARQLRLTQLPRHASLNEIALLAARGGRLEAFHASHVPVDLEPEHQPQPPVSPDRLFDAATRSYQIERGPEGLGALADRLPRDRSWMISISAPASEMSRIGEWESVREWRSERPAMAAPTPTPPPRSTTRVPAPERPTPTTSPPARSRPVGGESASRRDSAAVWIERAVIVAVSVVITSVVTTVLMTWLLH